MKKQETKLKVIVVNPPTEEQKDEMLKRIEEYFKLCSDESEVR